jgi:hypothetical protein
MNVHFTDSGDAAQRISRYPPSSKPGEFSP